MTSSITINYAPNFTNNKMITIQDPKKICPRCNGSGEYDDLGYITCVLCNGSGKIPHEVGDDLVLKYDKDGMMSPDLWQKLKVIGKKEKECPICRVNEGGIQYENPLTCNNCQCKGTITELECEEILQ